MIEPPQLACVRLHDRTLAEGHLTVARDGNLSIFFDRHNGCCMKCHSVSPSRKCSKSSNARSASIFFFSGLRVRRGKSASGGSSPKLMFMG